MAINNYFEDFGTKLGGVIGGSVGAIGYLAGPLVGTATTTSGTALGVFLGKITGRCSDDIFRFNEKVISTTDKLDKGASELKKGANKGQKAVGRLDSLGRNANSLVTILNGSGVLGVGLTLGVGLYLVGANCKPPPCEGSLQEIVRLASLALTTSGVGIIAIAGVKSVFN